MWLFFILFGVVVTLLAAFVLAGGILWTLCLPKTDKHHSSHPPPS